MISETSDRRILRPDQARASEPAPRLLRSLAVFGLTLAHARRRPRYLRDDGEVRAEIADIAAKIRPGTITLILGPSGAGKSTLVRALCRRLSECGDRRVRIAEPGKLEENPASVAELFSVEIDAMLGILGRVGLAEARLLALKPGELSVGQRWRLSLGLALEGAAANDVIVADEFCSTLDRVSALNLSAGLSRAWKRRGEATPALVCAAAHDDLLEALSAANVVRLTLRGDEN